MPPQQVDSLIDDVSSCHFNQLLSFMISGRMMWCRKVTTRDMFSFLSKRINRNHLPSVGLLGEIGRYDWTHCPFSPSCIRLLVLCTARPLLISPQIHDTWWMRYRSEHDNWFVIIYVFLEHADPQRQHTNYKERGTILMAFRRNPLQNRYIGVWSDYESMQTRSDNSIMSGDLSLWTTALYDVGLK